ncbi:hypothetical protein ECANGB1_1696 [Enterospora canceri]|uniref:Uncharacterized protein n=1 Tax=Enterospora canceri TaxID=1081671 RepID=A0A1Y1S931_9MICR|nr:hypothetical protein ECANGB1_1696 [Enterospora canceri]
MMRNSLFIALKQDRKMLSENMLHRIVNKLNSNESCVILLVGNRIKAEFIRALNEYPGYKEKLKPFLCHSESLRHKMSHLLENRRFRELTGYEKKLLFLIETNEQWFSSQQLYRHFSS